MIYSQGAIRHVCLSNCEILRHIYFAVRDWNWGTVPAHVLSEDIQEGGHDFRIRLAVEHREGDIHFIWRGTISGFPESRIVFSVEGEPRAEFFRNRIGLCVLHPLKNCATRECTVEHTNSTFEKYRFPELVSPHQPFFDVRSISYEPIPGVAAKVKLTGDQFETEDQRNWSDASFKTYSTPLSAPFPVKVCPGERLEQQAELSISGNIPAQTAEASPRVNVVVDRSRIYPSGAIGVLWDGGDKSRAFSHVRIDVRFENQAWREKVTAAADLGIPLEIAAFTDEPADNLAELHSVLSQTRAKLARLMVFAGNADVSDPGAVTAARGIFQNTSVGGGSCANFAELNRNRAICASLDFLAWPVNPRAHAVDDETMIENLEGQAPTIETAREFTGDRAFCISPVLAPEFPASSSWIACSLKHLLTAGAASVTYSRSDSVLQEIIEWQADSVVRSFSSHPLAVDALVMRKAGLEVAWIVNFRAEPQDVTFDRREYSLGPYAVLRTGVARA